MAAEISLTHTVYLRGNLKRLRLDFLGLMSVWLQSKIL
jgi:hypothetical protein